MAIKNRLLTLFFCLLAGLGLAACNGRSPDTSHLATAVPCPVITPLPVVTPTTMPPEVAAYLAEAVNHIQRHTVRASQIESWARFHDQVFSYAANAQTTSDTYPAIEFALTSLCDKHSFFLEPSEATQLPEGKAAGFGLIVVAPENRVVEVVAGGPADQAGVQAGDEVVLVNGRSPIPLPNKPYVFLNENPDLLQLQLRRGETRFNVSLATAVYNPNPTAVSQSQANRIAYLELPHFVGDGATAVTYATDIQKRIQELDAQKPCGWVLDLRRNNGGNLWPMLVGSGPLLKTGWIGSFVDADQKVTRWLLQPNGLWSGGHALLEIPGEGYRLQNPSAPLAVLTSRLTGSAAEGVVVAFLSRDHTRFFGELTAGVPTANRPRLLPDGAMLFVATAYFAQPNGTVYDGKIIPDEVMTVDWVHWNSPDDPVWQTAVTWLTSQCP